MIRKIVDSYKRWRRLGHLRGRRGPNFVPGDHAVCIGEGNWISFETGLPDTGPSPGQITTVTAIGLVFDCHVIQVKGWQDWFTADKFRKIIQDKTEAHNECPDLLKLIKHREDA